MISDGLIINYFYFHFNDSNLVFVTYIAVSSSLLLAMQIAVSFDVAAKDSILHGNTNATAQPDLLQTMMNVDTSRPFFYQTWRSSF